MMQAYVPQIVQGNQKLKEMLSPEDRSLDSYLKEPKADDTSLRPTAGLTGPKAEGDVEAEGPVVR